jgi:hypothetical protein
MLSREDLERFLDRLGAEGATSTEVEPNLWRVRPGGALDFDVAVSYAPPVALLRAKVMERPADPAADAALARRLLELNAGDLLHGAYGFDRGSVVLTDALELSHLDYEEFRASFESLTLALTAHVRELAACCAPNGHPDGAQAGAAGAAPTAAPAEAR